ncbi:urease subunit beta, partial [Pseudomonas soli]|nr:urease subunit beta [Pseudomonas soli]
TGLGFGPVHSRTVQLVAYAGKREVHGFQGKVMGVLEERA